MKKLAILMSAVALAACTTPTPEQRTQAPEQGARLKTAQTDGATAQQIDGCVKYAVENSNISLISVRLREQEPALTEVPVSTNTEVQVSTNTTGNVTECKIVKSGGSERVDGASCIWVKDHWRSLDRCQDHGPQL